MGKAYQTWIDKSLDQFSLDKFKKGEVLKARLPRQRDESWVDRKTSYHLSASVVTFVEGKLLMVFHPYQKEWLLPAGHVEQGEWPFETACRELAEETGRKIVPQDVKDLELIDLNLIPIQANPSKDEPFHYHLDCRYIFKGNCIELKEKELICRLVPDEEVPEEFRPYLRYRLN